MQDFHATSLKDRDTKISPIISARAYRTVEIIRGRYPRDVQRYRVAQHPSGEIDSASISRERIGKHRSW